MQQEARKGAIFQATFMVIWVYFWTVSIQNKLSEYRIIQRVNQTFLLSLMPRNEKQGVVRSMIAKYFSAYLWSANVFTNVRVVAPADTLALLALSGQSVDRQNHC